MTESGLADAEREGVQSAITIEQVWEICERELPFACQLGLVIERLDPGEATVRLPYRDDFVRPGGTIAGPLMMTMADFAMYIAVMSRIGPQVMAVTSNLNCSFLRRPRPGDLLAHARVLKLGRRLSYGEVSLFAEGEDEEAPAAHVTVTYSIPPVERAAS